MLFVVFCISDAKSSDLQGNCDLNPIAMEPLPISITLDNNPLKLQFKKGYTFQTVKQAENSNVVQISEITNFVFDNFRQTYFNFLSERVGPDNQCDKLELGKIQALVTKDGQAHGYFVARYYDRVCMFLRFFESKPGVEYDMFVLYVAKGITGVKNSFIPRVKDGKFSVTVKSVYQPIEAPSIFGRSEATLKGLYKKPLVGFLKAPSFTSLVESALPDKEKSDFKLSAIAFTESSDEKIQLTILSQQTRTPQQACAFKRQMLKNTKWTETK